MELPSDLRACLQVAFTRLVKEPELEPERERELEPEPERERELELELEPEPELEQLKQYEAASKYCVAAGRTVDLADGR